jgi:hypothetical protein
MDTSARAEPILRQTARADLRRTPPAAISVRVVHPRLRSSDHLSLLLASAQVSPETCRSLQRHDSNRAAAWRKERTMRNLKPGGLSLVAVLAVCLLAPSLASANQFHSASINTTQTVASNASFEFQYQTGGVTVVCTTVGGEGQTTSQTVTEVAFKPTFSGCQAKGIFGSVAHDETNGCFYLFTTEASANTGPAHIRCPEGKQFTITVTVFGVSLCTYHYGEQTPTAPVHYTNVSASEYAVQITPGTIVGTRTGSSECGSEKSTTGSITGKITFKGEITGQQTQTKIQVG